MPSGANISIPASEQARFKSWINSVSKETRANVQNAVEASVYDLRRRAVQFAPHDKGFLKAKSYQRLSSDRLSGEVGFMVHYAPYQEFGTGSMVKVSSDVKEFAMQFKGKGIRRVNMRPHPFLLPSLRMASRQLIHRINKLGFR